MKGDDYERFRRAFVITALIIMFVAAFYLAHL
jgi:hypothetical protein